MPEINGRELSLAAIAEWVAELPEDFQFARTGRRYTCDCLVGRYINANDQQKYSVGYSFIGEAYQGEIEVTEELRRVIRMFDDIHSDEITAGELRKRILAYLLLG